METEMSQCAAISTPKWQPNSKRGTRQILRRSDIPRDMWRYYIKPPEKWKRNDNDKTGLHNGVKSILMMNSFQTIIPWWMQTMSLDRLVDLKLKLTSAIRAAEEFKRYNSKVKFNNHLSLEYKKEQASMVYKNLQTTSEELHTATNTVNTFGRFGPGYGPLNENFQDHINRFVMYMDDDSEEIRDDYFADYDEEIRDSYITDYEKDTTPPTSPLQYPLPADESENDAGEDSEPVVTHVKRALEASPHMASRNSPDMPLLPQDSVEAIIVSATTLSSQHKDKVYDQEEDKEGNENDDTDT